MKISFLSLFLLVGLAACSSQPAQTPSFNIIPKPARLVAGTEWIRWDRSVFLVGATEEEKKVAYFLQEFLKGKGITTEVGERASISDNQVVFSIIPTIEAGPEGYQLLINDQGVHISAQTGTGLFYGLQSLFQMLQPAAPFTLPYVDIFDQPRFAWRGLHLDVSRHFFPVTFVKKYIDLLSHYKLNTFHWHLTDDQGWRVEIKKYPKLQEVSAYRKETLIGLLDAKDWKYDGVRHGGFYTQEQIKEVVAYAAARHVTVVPEIEMPGHGLAALSAYPYLGCTGGPYSVATHWGVYNDVFCAGKESTFQFLQDVIDEIVPLFPGKYIHIGGDECPKKSWEKCPYCQLRIKTEKLKNEHELQSYFVQRMEKYINSRGKQVIGWDEILEGGLAPNAAVMSWRGEAGGIAAAKLDHDVVMTPTDWLYLDYYQDKAKTEPLAIGGYVPVSKVYGYEPVPAQLTEDQAKHILGVQANVWTEYMASSDYIEYMVYPRAMALAEVAWSPKEKKDYPDFVRRANGNRGLLDAWKVNYAKHLFVKKDSAR